MFKLKKKNQKPNNLPNKAYIIPSQISDCLGKKKKVIAQFLTTSFLVFFLIRSHRRCPIRSLWSCGARRSKWWFFANLPRHVVQRKTLAAPDNNAFVMVLPGSEDKEPSLGTGFHTFASRLCQVGKAILLKENKGEAPVEGSPHYRLLSRRDRWRHQDGTL